MFEIFTNVLGGGMCAVNEARTRQDNGAYLRRFGSVERAEQARDYARDGNDGLAAFCFGLAGETEGRHNTWRWW